jgi:hypothetical protein
MIDGPPAATKAGFEHDRAGDLDWSTIPGRYVLGYTGKFNEAGSCSAPTHALISGAGQLLVICGIVRGEEKTCLNTSSALFDLAATAASNGRRLRLDFVAK